jgi:hypothetical protein
MKRFDYWPVTPKFSMEHAVRKDDAMKLINTIISVLAVIVGVWIAVIGALMILLGASCLLTLLITAIGLGVGIASDVYLLQFACWSFALGLPTYWIGWRIMKMRGD